MLAERRTQTRLVIATLEKELWPRFVAELRRLGRQLREDATARRVVLAVAGLCVLVLCAAVMRDVLGFFDIHIRGMSVFSIGRDGGAPELFMYGCELACAAGCFASFRNSGKKSFLFMALLFAFIAVDDSLAYHERLGHLIAPQSQNLGELLAWALAALLLLPPLVWCVARMRRDELGVYLVFAVVFAALVVFAVGADLVHALAKAALGEHERTAKIIGRLLGWVEDGGELVVVSAAACVGLTYARATRPERG